MNALIARGDWITGVLFQEQGRIFDLYMKFHIPKGCVAKYANINVETIAYQIGKTEYSTWGRLYEKWIALSAYPLDSDFFNGRKNA